MLRQHVLNSTLSVEAIYGFEQQFTDFMRIAVSAGLLELFQQLLDIAP